LATVKYSLEEFTQDMESLLKSQPGDQQVFDKGSAWLERLVSKPDSIPLEFRLPLGAGPAPTTPHGCSIKVKAACRSPQLSGAPETVLAPMTTVLGA